MGVRQASARSAALDVLADRDYFDGQGLLACAGIGVTPYVSKLLTSGSKVEGCFGKQGFGYRANDDMNLKRGNRGPPAEPKASGWSSVNRRRRSVASTRRAARLVADAASP